MSEPNVRKSNHVSTGTQSTMQGEHELVLTTDESQHDEQEIAHLDDSDGDMSYDGRRYDSFEEVIERNISLVEFHGLRPGNCGYCKQNNPDLGGRLISGMVAHKLKASEYQDLIDRNWRRSGKYCYQPHNESTCCPNYPIISDALNFKLTRSHRKCILQLNNFLLNGSSSLDSNKNLKPNYQDHKLLRLKQRQLDVDRRKNFTQLEDSSKSKDRRYVAACKKRVEERGISLEEAIAEVRKKWLDRKPKILPLEAYLHPKKPRVPSSENRSSQMIEAKHKLVIKMCYVNSSESKAMRRDEHNILKRYQAAVHKETADDWSMSRFCDFLVRSPIIADSLDNYDYLPNSLDSPDVDDRADKSEIMSVNVDFGSSDHLLIEPPNLPTAYGTYHCTYHLDYSLIAVGVLDVLPKSITTVYFFYDPAYEHLNLGIYSALIEISMIRRMHEHYIGPDENKLIWYNIGFYVPTCKKMHYKTRFRPAHLLCSETYTYVPIETCLKKLEKTKYARFYDDELIGVQDSHDSHLQKFARVPLVSPVTKYNNSPLEYLAWLRHNLSEEACDVFWSRILEPFVHAIGYPLSERLCLQVNAVHFMLEDYHRRRLQSSSNSSR